MKKFSLLIVFCLSFTFLSNAQQKQDSIRVLFHLLKKDSILDKKIESKLPMLMELAESKDTAMKITEGVRDTVVMLLQTAKDLSLKIQEEEMALYGRYFTQQEINELIAFYRSPLGQKFTDLTTVIESDLKQIVEEKFAPELMELVKLFESLKLKGKE